MIDWILKWFKSEKKPCRHENTDQRLWNAEDGTPMVKTSCLDCGWIDVGHVYGDSWTEEEIRRINESQR